MNNIYTIIFYDGWGKITIWGYTNSEEDAKAVVKKLNNQLRIDERMIIYLQNNRELIFDENNNPRDNEYAEEFELLLSKYPYDGVDNVDMGSEFYYKPIIKLELD